MAIERDVQPGVVHGTIERNVNPKGDELISDLSTVKELTVPEGAEVALIQAQVQNVRFRDSGDDPTSSVGIQIPAGQSFYYTGLLSAVKLIAETAGAEAFISYYSTN